MSDNLVETAPRQLEAVVSDLAEECEVLQLSVAEKRKTFPAQCSMMLAKALKKEIQHLMSVQVELPQPDQETCRLLMSSTVEPQLQLFSAPQLESTIDKVGVMIQRLKSTITILDQIENEKMNDFHQDVHQMDA